MSFVLPVYNEVEGIEAFHRALVATVDSRADIRAEFLYVNDGSRDGSLAVLRALGDRDERVQVLDLSRNFGHQIAITAGLDAASGDAVIIMDTDLQDPPVVCLELVDVWRTGADIVYAQRQSRRDTAFKRFSAWLYYRLLQVFAEVDIPRNTGDFRLLDRRAADALRSHRERNRFVRGMVASLGFEQVAVPFARDERTSGSTNYPLSKMLRLAADGITSFSSAPLRWITRLGMLTVGLAVLGILYAVVRKFVVPESTVEGWTLLLVAVLFLGGVQMLSLGVIGSYIGRIYSEVQGRPLYLLRPDERRAPAHEPAPARGDDR